VGVIVFILAVGWWDTHLGAVAAAAVSALITGITWVIWWTLTKPPNLSSVVLSPLLGTVPVAATPSPALASPQSAPARAYLEAADHLEEDTTGHILLVSSPVPGQGTSTVALNLAISATRSGRKVVLIDGDVASGGLSRFGHTEPTPGLIELAAGEATLAEASRLWTLDPDSRLPFIPSGATDRTDKATLLRSAQLARAIDELSEHADLLLIDTAPVNWNGAAAPLAAHADGTVLVVSDGAETEAITTTRERLKEVGAPVVGYVVNHTGDVTDRPLGSPPIRMLKRSLATFLITLAVFATWNAAQIWNSWRTVERDELSVAVAEDLLPLPAGGIVSEDIDEVSASVVTAPPTPEGEFTSFLIVGSDKGGSRADVIILTMIPTGDEPPLMVSLPRDLYLPNRCFQNYSRINANLAGCGDDVNGPTLLALAVEDFTGVQVDHFALFDFEGFESIIDEVDGVEICLTYAVRDSRSDLDLPAGCTVATGEQALAWVRSRHTQEYVDGRWRTMPGVSDLTRNQRQQEVILAMVEKARSFASPNDLTAKVASLTDFFTFDDQLGLPEAISIAWGLREVSLDGVHRIEIPVKNHRTSDGAAVLIPTESFDVLLEAVFPDLSPT
jgi:LCP family protein required for cell wall assembly